MDLHQALPRRADYYDELDDDLEFFDNFYHLEHNDHILHHDHDHAG